jgi:hypothetical protein
MKTQDRDVKGLGRIVRGSISAAGGIVRGTGFIVTKTGTGGYTITFLQPFRSIPTVFAINNGGNGYIVSTANFSLSQCQVFTGIPAGAGIDGAFDFVAIEGLPT